MKKVLTKGLIGVIGVALWGLLTLPANAVPIALLGGAASHLFHFGGAAAGLFHASHALGATSVLAKSATYSRGLTAARVASSNVARTAALAPRYPTQGFRTPGMSQINNLPPAPHQVTPPGAPVPPGAFPPAGPWHGPYYWDHDDAAWFVGGVFIGAAITPLFVAQPVYYYPAYPGYYYYPVPADPPADSSSNNTSVQKKVEPTANTDTHNPVDHQQDSDNN